MCEHNSALAFVSGCVVTVFAVAYVAGQDVAHSTVAVTMVLGVIYGIARYLLRAWRGF